jgi:hypothetical protein
MPTTFEEEETIPLESGLRDAAVAVTAVVLSIVLSPADDHSLST